MKSVVRTLADLGEDLVLAPERWLATRDVGDGVPLGDLVVERRERVVAGEPIVLDTTHARDGVIDVSAAIRAATSPRSAKKSARAGEIIVSRLRPYLRQIAYVHPAAQAVGRPFAVSTEYYVLAPRVDGEDIAFLVPFLLAEPAQAVLAAAQEGGHHPRVPLTSLLALRVPKALVAAREERSREIRAALATLYAATAHYRDLLDGASA